MQRGIQYAEDERRIENLTINKGQIFATVQGTAALPYRVKINFETIPEEGWKKIINDFSNRIINLIKLLEGDLPEDIISIFKNSNYPLFPDAAKGLNATCSCPDKEVPCKHIAAIILYIALVLDYDPFILLKLRGKSKNEILSNLSLTQISDAELIKKESEVIQKAKNIEFSFNLPKISIQELSKKKTISEGFQKIGFKFKKPPKIIETLENLGLPPNLDNPRAFENVFRAIYRSITTQIYKTATKFEKIEKN